MRKNLRKSSIALAVAAAGVGVVGLSTQAVAVQIGEDGLGEALVYPYFTTNNGFRTLIHVINTSDTHAVAYKIRMRDAHNSRDCRDFNVVLSPDDVWTASIEEGADGQPRIWTNDNSCTSPTLTQTDRGGRFVNFTSADYDGTGQTPADAGINTIDRCREGYIEIIEMGASNGNDLITQADIVGSYYDAALHDDNGIPANCNKIAIELNNVPANQTAIDQEFGEPLNVLKGNYTLVSTSTGQGFGGSPLTLANFFSPNLGIDGADTRNIISNAGGFDPALKDADPAKSFVTDTKNGGVIESNWSRGIDAVSAVITRSSVINEWSTNPGFGSNTDWAVTFPTKRDYADPAVNQGGNPTPFTEMFGGVEGQGESCVKVAFNSWNREEKTTAQQNDFSPPVRGKISSLCYEANIITYNRTGGEGVLNSLFPNNINNSVLGLFGWTRIGLLEDANQQIGITSIGGDNYKGLPVIGFAVLNRSTQSNTTNFGALFDHAYERSIMVSN